MAIHQLVAGVHNFQGNVFQSQQELFTRLAQGQSPETLFITCSDSRIDPNLITQTEPGDLFVLRNAGNIVPAFSGSAGGEIATIEFAITGLGVKQIVVCGHSHCGAIRALLQLVFSDSSQYAILLGSQGGLRWDGHIRWTCGCVWCRRWMGATRWTRRRSGSV